MQIICGHDIKMVRGDSATFKLDILESMAPKKEYVLDEDDTVTFRVRKQKHHPVDDETLIFAVTLDKEAMTFKLPPEITANLDYGVYYYSVVLVASTDIKHTINSGIFEIIR